MCIQTQMGNLYQPTPNWSSEKCCWKEYKTRRMRKRAVKHCLLVIWWSMHASTQSSYDFLHKTSTEFQQGWGRASMAPLLLEKGLAAGGFWESVTFLSGCACLWVIHTPVDTSTAICTWSELIEAWGLMNIIICNK